MLTDCTLSLFLHLKLSAESLDQLLFRACLSLPHFLLRCNLQLLCVRLVKPYEPQGGPGAPPPSQSSSANLAPHFRNSPLKCVRLSLLPAFPAFPVLPVYSTLRLDLLFFQSSLELHRPCKPPSSTWPLYLTKHLTRSLNVCCARATYSPFSQHHLNSSFQPPPAIPGTSILTLFTTAVYCWKTCKPRTAPHFDVSLRSSSWTDGLFTSLSMKISSLCPLFQYSLLKL